MQLFIIKLFIYCKNITCKYWIIVYVKNTGIKYRIYYNTETL